MNGVRTLWLVGLCLTSCLVGCSKPRPKLVAVTGTVTMEGKGLTAGSIVFHPNADNSYKEDKPSSLLQLDGSFTMKTYPFGDGVAPGKYKVTLGPEVASRIGRPEFGKVENTPWSIDVPETGLDGQKFEVK